MRTPEEMLSELIALIGDSNISEDIIALAADYSAYHRENELEGDIVS